MIGQMHLSELGNRLKEIVDWEHAIKPVIQTL